jgi:sirohydrochlorin cobaltochelatase
VHGGPGVAEIHAEALRPYGGFAAVSACCLTGRPTLAEAVGDMGQRPIVVVPTLMADGHTAAKALPRALAAVRGASRIAVRAPIGTNPRLAALACARARAVSAALRWNPRETMLTVAAHGTSRDTRSAATAFALVESLRGTRAFAVVDAAFLDQAPRLADLLQCKSTAGPRIIVGLFADGGGHGEDDVRAMADAAGDQVAYTGPLGTLREFADIIYAQAVDEPAS